MVMFPLGMGAFLRKLPDKCAWYHDVCRMRELRREIAKRFTFAMRIAPHVKVHFCCIAPRDPNWQSCVNEAEENQRAWRDAFEEAGLLDRSPHRLQMHDRDALMVARELAANESDPQHVMLVNGANRRLLLSLIHI